jgi:hypothetical protein
MSESNINLNYQQLNSVGLKHLLENVTAHSNFYTFLLCMLKQLHIIFDHFLLISAHMITAYLG